MTGFLWNSTNETFLVTNWHNVTGLNSVNHRPNGTFCPTSLTLEFRVCLLKTNGQDLLTLRRREIRLYDEKGNPIWREHQLRSSIDLVVLHIPNALIGHGSIFCLNAVEFENRWQPEIGAECFVVGFPEGLSGPLYSPIWKRGSIASEPAHNHGTEPVFLIDTLGNEGLSGSPVIGESSGVFTPDPTGKMTGDSILGRWRRFIGVYSGRTSKEGVGFQLGRVWKPKLLDEIFEAGVPGHHPLINGRR